MNGIVIKSSIKLSAILLVSMVFLAGFVSAENSIKNWQVIGPTGGDVREIVVDPKNKDHLFVSTLDGQVHASYDAGASWVLLANFQRPQLILDSLIVDPRDSQIIYTAGHRHKQPGGFFKTKDGGKSWRESPELKGEAIHAMVQAGQDPNMLLVGTVTGVWISRDSGDTWTKFTSNTVPQKLDALAIDPEDKNTIYAGTWWRAYKTTDGGANWRLVKKGMIDDSDVFSIDINPEDPDKIIAAACSGIYRSINKGEQWKKVQGIPSQSRRTRDILHNPGMKGFVYAGTTEGLWMSTDGGISWRLRTSKTIEINSIAVHPEQPNRVFIGTNNYGVMVSEDAGRSFKLRNGNFSSRFTYNIIPDVERPNRLYATTINTATGGGYIFVSNDFGVTWVKSVGNLDTNRTIVYSLVQDKAAPNKIYLATNFGIIRSIDRGITWKLLKGPKPRRVKRGRRWRTIKPKPLPNGAVRAITKKVTVLIPTSDGKNGYLAGSSKGLYRSYDIDKGWEKLSFGEGLNDNIFALHVSPKMPQIIWAGTATSGVVVSNDGGATWTKTPVIPDGVPVSSIASDPTKPENLFVGTTQTFYLSRDLGKTWVRRGGNLPIGNFTSILIDPEKTNEMYISSSYDRDGGIYYSQDNGWSWKRVDVKSQKLASRRVWSLSFNPDNTGEILAGTHSSGIYKIPREVPVAKKVDSQATKRKMIVRDLSNQ
ncbi:MAG: hypothetical protein HKN33_15035 [Pyrinomonadaceae bacterium]|nr:hypothetical protein [Pyrinomonadaceae bacterium]